LFSIYSWHNIPLTDHLERVFKLFHHLYQQELDTVSWKICAITNSHKAKGEVKKVLELAVLLHDAGKGLKPYQKSISLCPNEPKKHKCSFVWHEVPSAYIYYNYTLFSFRENEGISLARNIGFLSILHHHHAMRVFLTGKNRGVDDSIEEIKKLSKKTNTELEYDSFAIESLNDILQRHGYNCLDDELTKRLKSKNIINEAFKHVQILINKIKISKYNFFLKLHEALTSPLSISDNLTASVEREHKFKGYSARLASELGLNVNYVAKIIGISEES